MARLAESAKARANEEQHMSPADIDEPETSSLPWPRLSDRVFVKAPPFSGAWVANRADERLFRMIKGFQEAGDLLVSESKGEPHRAQNLVYPAVFAYRQCLELHLSNCI